MAASQGLRGVRDDLSELGRHLLDIACFLSPLLAPPAHNDSPPPSPRLFPPPHHHHPRRRPLRLRRRLSPSPRPPSARVLAGIIRDFAEIGGGLRSGLSRLSIALVGPVEEEEPAVDDHRPHQQKHHRSVDSRAEEPVGVSEDVHGFVCDLVKCPESWLEFPVILHDDFHMSHTQREHVETMQRLAPELAALRFSLCPSNMSEGSFWRIYFALLHPRLSKRDSQKLSTLQILDSIRLALKGTQSRLPTRSQSFGSHGLLPAISHDQQYESRALPNLMITRTGSQQSIGQFSEAPSIVDVAWPNLMTTRMGSQQSIGQLSEVSRVDVAWPNGMTTRTGSQQSISELSEVPSIVDAAWPNLMTIRTGSQQSIGQFSEVSSIVDAAWLNQMTTRTGSQQSIGQLSEVPSIIEVSSERTNQFRTEDASFSSVDHDNVMVENYIDSLRTEAVDVSSFSRRKHALVSSDENNGAQRGLQTKIFDKGSGDWSPVEDSDFELVNEP